VKTHKQEISRLTEANSRLEGRLKEETNRRKDAESSLREYHRGQRNRSRSRSRGRRHSRERRRSRSRDRRSRSRQRSRSPSSRDRR
jgi:hypothetical protein